MGKEQSKGAMPQIEDTTIHVTDSYVLNKGVFNDSPCSVFSGASSASLEALANNLKTHRHPSIVKYIASGTHDGRFYAVTEPVDPLFLVIADQSPLQICVGLHKIVTALSFLHTQANSSHNNVCSAAIYVTADGSWKLGGLEFMCKFAAMTSSKLKELSVRRYEPAVAPEERSGRIIPPAIDVFALGVLVEHLLTTQCKGDLPGLSDMLDFCKTKMLAADPTTRVNQLTDIFNHTFFDHDFIKIQKFLSELPLKSSEEKLVFFRELETQLKTLPETMVASQLLHLLLSRMVVMESSAHNILPMLLRPNSDGQDGSLFSDDVFKQYVVPKILQMFCVRDTSVRLLLLTHLQSYIKSFTKDQLQKHLLPELLVGIKDESDELVASTLHALAFLVGALGRTAVVGGQRARLFSDGRPAARRPRPEDTLPERPSPDGGEDSVADDTEAWSDWDQSVPKNVELDEENAKLEMTPVGGLESDWKTTSRQRAQNVPHVPAALADIATLDIKYGGGWRGDQGPDFFTDMEPVISKTHVALIEQVNKFGVSDSGSGTAGDAWETFEDWGDAAD